jgi:two-component system chemotaxis response regulator CheY
MAIKQVGVPKGLNYLVLDDMENFRTAIITQLTNLNVEGNIFQAENVKQAKEILAKNKINFILCDWNLPDGTGLELLESVRAEIKYKETPFLMITTKAEISHVLGAISSGASNYLIKPWKPKEFIDSFLASWEKHNSN